MYGLALVVLCGIGATSALASPIWEQCSEGGSATKYSSNQCSKAEGGGKWQWNELAGTEKFRGLFSTLTLRDTKTPEKESVIRCTKGVEEGTVGPDNEGLVIEKAEVKEASKNCVRLEGPCKAEGVEKVEGVDLPWQQEFSETEKKFSTAVEPFGTGEPGWNVTCKTILGSTSDTCTTESASKEEGESLENVLTGGVSSIIASLKKLHKAKCSVGGAESGVVEGGGNLENGKGTGVRLQPTVVRLAVARIAGPGMAASCEFIATALECQIEVKNESSEEVTLTTVAIRGGNAAHFELKEEECKPNVKLEPRGFRGNKCASKVKAVGAAGGRWADFFVVARSNAGINRTIVATLRW
ncbi:MAG: hypothetical protein ACRDLF_04710 [Solirubrobacteraceae bacterium]